MRTPTPVFVGPMLVQPRERVRRDFFSMGFFVSFCSSGFRTEDLETGSDGFFDLFCRTDVGSVVAGGLLLTDRRLETEVAEARVRLGDSEPEGALSGVRRVAGA